jgi:hypothetical protein
MLFSCIVCHTFLTDYLIIVCGVWYDYTTTEASLCCECFCLISNSFAIAVDYYSGAALLLPSIVIIILLMVQKRLNGIASFNVKCIKTVIS